MIHKSADLKIKAAQAQAKAEATPQAETAPAPAIPHEPVPPTPEMQPPVEELLEELEQPIEGTPTLMEGGTAPPRPEMDMEEGT